MSPRSEIITQDGRLYHLGIAPTDVTGAVFLVGDPARAHRVAERFESIECEVTNREYVTLTGIHKGVPMTVVGTGIGTDNVEIALIELDAANGIDLETGKRKPHAAMLDIIRIGTSGGVHPSVPAGTLCVAEYALGLDSTGPYYESPVADEVVQQIETEARRLLDKASGAATRFRGRLPAYASKANPLVAALLTRHAVASGMRSATGITVSAPGFFGPSSRYIEGLTNTVPDIKGTLAGLSVGKHRVLNMEMESSLLFHLAGALGHRAGTICPAISESSSAATPIDYGAYVEAAIDTALAAMVDLRTLNSSV